MEDDKDKRSQVYTCNEYREEMILAALQRRLRQEGLAEPERRTLLEEIARLEKKMGL